MKKQVNLTEAKNDFEIDFIYLFVYTFSVKKSVCQFKIQAIYNTKKKKKKTITI